MIFILFIGRHRIRPACRPASRCEPRNVEPEQVRNINDTW